MPQFRPTASLAALTLLGIACSATPASTGDSTPTVETAADASVVASEDANAPSFVTEAGAPIDAPADVREPSHPPNLAKDIKVEQPFTSVYRVYDLGQIPGAPALRYGGAVLKPGNPNTLLIGVDSEAATGKIMEIGIDRGWDGHVIGFTGVAKDVATAPNVDANLLVAANGALLFSSWPVNRLGQILANATTPAKITDLGPLGVDSVAGMGFVPSTFPAGVAGTLKTLSWSTCTWASVYLTTNGALYDVTSATQHPGSKLPNGCGGFSYIPKGSPQFAAGGLMVAEWANAVSAFDVDALGDPLPATRKPFLTGLTGSWAAYFDTVSGDYLFPSWGKSPDTIIVVQGFVPPPPAPPPPPPPPK